MSKKTIGILMVILGVVAFHLLGSHHETSAQWTVWTESKIYSNPMEVNKRFVVFGGDKGKRTYNLFEVNQQGKISARSIDMPVFCWQPMAFNDRVVIADKSNMIRAFKVPGLELIWETATQEPILFEPVKINDGHLLVVSGKTGIYYLDVEDGDAIWNYQSTKAITSYNADSETMVCIAGYADIKKPKNTLTGHSIYNGEALWTFDEPVSADRPLFIQDFCVVTTAEGNLAVINKHNGSLAFKDSIAGLRLFQILDDRVLMLAAGGSRIVCFSLMTGQSWTITTNSSLTGAGKYLNKILLATKKDVRCIHASDGSLVWTRNLEDIYNAFPFRKGLFLTHKDSFFDRKTYGSYISVESANSKWTTFGQSIFNKPLITEIGDLVASYNGMVRLIPSPHESEENLSEGLDKSETAATTEIKSQILSITASEAAAPEQTTVKPEPEPEAEAGQKVNTLTPDLEIKDTGWLNEK